MLNRKNYGFTDRSKPLDLEQIRDRIEKAFTHQLRLGKHKEMQLLNCLLDYPEDYLTELFDLQNNTKNINISSRLSDRVKNITKQEMELLLKIFFKITPVSKEFGRKEGEMFKGRKNKVDKSFFVANGAAYIKNFKTLNSLPEKIDALAELTAVKEKLLEIIMQNPEKLDVLIKKTKNKLYFMEDEFIEPLEKKVKRSVKNIQGLLF